MSSSLPTLSSVPSDQFYDIVEITNPPTMQVESVRREESESDALYARGGYEHIMLRMESHELSSRNRISEEMARTEFEVMEKDARYAFFFQNYKFQIAV